MSKTPEDLEPDLKQLYDIVKETGKQGIPLDILFDKLNIDRGDVDSIIVVMDSLIQLREYGLAYKDIIQSKFGRGTLYEIRWFVGERPAFSKSRGDPGMPI